MFCKLNKEPKPKDIADTMVEVVKEHYQVLNEAEILQFQAFIDEQLNLSRASLLEAEKNLESSKETVDVDSLKKEIQARVSQETSLTQEYSNITMSLVEQEAMLARAEEELQKQDRFYVLSKSIVEDLAYRGLLDKLTKDDIALLQKVKSESQQINPVYLNLEQTVVNARVSIAASEAKEPILKGKIEENKVALNKLQAQLAEKEPEWETLTEDYNLANKEYQNIRNTHREAEKLLAAAEARQLKTVSTAGVPSSPIEPKTKRIMLIAAVIGLLAVLFLAFFLEYLGKMKKLETESKRQKN